MPGTVKTKLLVLFSLVSTIAFSQDKQHHTNDINLFLDCSGCDMDFIKTEIRFVNFVRDRFTANVYVLPASQTTGSGGEQITLFIYGQKEFEGMNDTLTLYKTSVETDGEFRKKGVRYLKMALVRFIARTGHDDLLTISMNNTDSAGTGNADEEQNKKDKWNYWVFNVGLSGNYYGNDLSKSGRINAYVSANRVTEKMKCYLSAYASGSQQKYIYNGVESVFPNNSKNISATYVKSINSHWSAGGFSDYQYSSFSNYRNKLSLEPAVEYSVYKYAEAVKKSITVFYKIGPSYNEYIDSAYYDSPENLLLSHTLSFRMSFTQKWGTLNFNASGNSFLNHFHLNNATINGESIRQVSFSCDMSLRIIKGLSLNAYSMAEFTEGIYPNITRAAFTRDELLTNTRQYPTSKFLYFNLGLSYRFGSIYNNFVNPRFNN